MIRRARAAMLADVKLRDSKTSQCGGFSSHENSPLCGSLNIDIGLAGGYPSGLLREGHSSPCFQCVLNERLTTIRDLVLSLAGRVPCFFVEGSAPEGAYLRSSGRDTAS